MPKLDAPGLFHAKVVEAQIGRSKKKQTPQVAIMFEVTDGDHAGQHITWFGYFSGGAMERTFATLRMLGFRGNDLYDLSSVIGGEANIDVAEEEYNGKFNLKVQWVNDPKEGGRIALGSAMDDGDLRAFADSMKGELISYDETHKTKQPEGPPPIDGDDIPF